MLNTSAFLNRPWLGIVILLLIGTGIGYMTMQQISDARSARVWITHTNQVLDHIDLATEEIMDAESAQRGYLLNGDEEYLTPYAEVTGQAIDGSYDPERRGMLVQELVTLRDLTLDNPEQTPRVAKLSDLVDARIQHMAGAIEVAHKQGLEQAREFVKDKKGLILTQEIKSVLTEIQQEETNLLSKRTARGEEVFHRNSNTRIALAIFLVSFLLISFLFIQREFRRRILAEATMRKNAAFLDALLANSRHAIIAGDLSGTIVIFNRAAEQMLGYTADEMVGKHGPQMLHLSSEVDKRTQELQAELGRPLTGIEVFTHKPATSGFEERDWTYVRKDGTHVPVQLVVTPIKDDQNFIHGYVGIALDITERKQIERMKNEFVSTVSHELRTPLTSIRGSLGLLLGSAAGALPEKARELLGIAHKNSERLVRLINNILDIEKIESNGIRFDMHLLRADQIMRQAGEANQAFALQYGSTIAIREEDKDLFVMGDEDRMQQVMTNLLSNAIKFSPAGSEILMSSKRVAEGVQLSVENPGPGIPEEFRARIFGKFAQADASDSRQKGGSGLGLSISRAIVESMKGTVGFESAPGRTIFYAVLPSVQAQNLFGTDTVTCTSTPSQKNILVCEDDPDIGHLLCLSLERVGYHCDLVGTAAAAKEALAKTKYMAMTLDLGLPDQNGLSLVQEMRDDPMTAPLPVVIVTAQQKNEKMLGDAAGILDWMTKPIDLERLKRTLLALAPNGGLPRILHVEDDLDLSKMIAISMQGMAIIQTAPSCSQARASLAKDTYDLVILDNQLPDGKGYDLLPVLAQKNPPIPAIILSATETSADVQSKVLASLVKSSMPEDKVVDIIMGFIKRRSA